MKSFEPVIGQLKLSLTSQPLLLMSAEGVSEIGELFMAGAGDEGGLLAMSLVSPLESSTTLFIVKDGAPESAPEPEERAQWMEARETLRHLLHPAGRLVAEYNTRQVVLGALKTCLNKEAETEHEAGLPVLTQPDAWKQFIDAFEKGEDRPRAFGVEKAYIVEGHLVSIRDLNGSLNDFYQIET